MPTATLTDMSGATDPDVPFGNDANLIDQELTLLDASNINENRGVVQISSTFSMFELDKLRQSFASFDGLGAVEALAIDNLVTWKQSVASVVITEMHVSTDKSIALDAGSYWVFKLETASSRSGTWTTQATVTFDASSGEYDKSATSLSVDVPVSRYARVKAQVGNPSLPPMANITITLVGEYAQVTA